MKYSYNWLRKLSGTKLSAEKVAELLTMHSFELESLEKVGGNLENIFVGKILEILKHPNADKLQLVKVDVGPSLLTSLPKGERESKKYLNIVCGAWNIKEGDKVPVALVGAKLPNGLEIKEAEIRGVKSFGMLCAEDELGLGTDHSGIMILDKDAKVGNSLVNELEMNDTIIELDVLANRGHDALSHLAIALEICAIESRKSIKSIKAIKSEKSIKSGKSKVLKVEVKDKKLCPRYFATVMENIEVKESPMWVKSVLRNLGMKSINNIVDATNYVMLEMGQPLHAFDYNKLKIQNSELKTTTQNLKVAKIIVRSAKNGENIKLLDGSTKELKVDDIVIANEDKILALAGVMGGEDSGISQDTKTIVIESANFNPKNIRKTRMRLGLQTDASTRFEKGIDPNLAELAMARVVEIISWMEGKVEGSVDFYPNKIKPWKIRLNLDYVRRLLGENIKDGEIIKILKLLNLKVIGHQSSAIKRGLASRDRNSRKRLSLSNVDVEIPTIRIDLKTQEDLIEEVGRVYGYENIRSQVPLAPVQTPIADEKRLFIRNLKNILAGLGFSEVYNYSFYSWRDAETSQAGTIDHLEVDNPMNPNQELMRVNLITGLMKNVRHNRKNFETFGIFEIGNVYWKINSRMPDEKLILSGALVDKNGRGKKGYEFYELKGILEVTLQKLGLEDWYFDEFQASSEDTLDTLWHAGRTAEIKAEGSDEAIGFVGEINPLVLSDFDIQERVAVFEIDVAKLRCLVDGECEYQPIRKFPVVMRDISMLAPPGILVDEILRVIQKAGGDLVLDADLFDVYDIAEDNVTSFAFHLKFGAEDRTLESGEVDVLMKRVVEDLESKIGVKVRI